MKNGEIKANSYKFLRCPYCKSPLRPGFLIAADEVSSRLTYGTMLCACTEYPVVDGIVYLHKDKQKRNIQAVALLKQGNINGTVNALVQERRLVRLGYRLLQRHYLGVPGYRLVSLKLLLHLLDWLNPSSRLWYRYLRNRNKRASFLLSLVPLGTVSNAQIIADVGCGLGNFLSLAGRWFDNLQLIGIDSSFALLWLARHYLVDPKVLLVCSDVEAGLPIVNGTIDRIFFNDSFMYIKNQARCLTEINRSLTNQGLAFLTHVHLRGAHNLGQGYGTTPILIQQQAKGLVVAAVSDKTMFTQLLQRRTITYEQVGLTLTISQSFSVVLGKRLPESSLTVRVLPQLKTYLQPVSIDYFEDEQLNINSEGKYL